MSGDRHHGRRYLLDRLVAAGPSKRKISKSPRRALGVGYEVMDIKEDADEGEFVMLTARPDAWLSYCSD